VAKIDEIHDELEALNREREAYEADARAKAITLATQRNLMYREAVTKRDAIGQAGITADGEIVRVFDPKLLDKDTLAILEHMGTPVPPVDEVFPDGVTIHGGKKTGGR
jgi:hypothetical protein